MSNNFYESSAPEGRWKPTVLFWIVAAVVLLLVILFAFAGGIGAVLAILGLVALLTGLYRLLFKRKSWVGLPHQKSGKFVAIAGALALVLGLGVGAATAEPRADIAAAGASTATPSPTRTATPTPTPTPTATNPVNSVCSTAAATQKYNSQTLVCTEGADQRLVWMTEAESKRLVAAKVAADKAAADKAAADAAAAEKAAADKAAADKLAADQAAQAAAEQAARDAAARQAAPQAPAPVVPAPAPAPAPASVYYPNCAAARAAGAAPVYAGSPGYGTHLDRDKDGIGCDK